MNLIRNTLKLWLPLALAITFLAGLVYLAVQQSYRSGANDPQIQMAEDGAAVLAGGQAAQALVPAGTVDIAKSLAPYLIVFDADGKPVTSNALLDGQIPLFPPGVFAYTRAHGEDRISYQPRPGVRSAVVVVAANGGQAGFVVAGRSLREVEERIDRLTQIIGIVWLAAMLASVGLVAFFEVVHL